MHVKVHVGACCNLRCMWVHVKVHVGACCNLRCMWVHVKVHVGACCNLRCMRVHAIRYRVGVKISVSVRHSLCVSCRHCLCHLSSWFALLHVSFSHLPAGFLNYCFCNPYPI